MWVLLLLLASLVRRKLTSCPLVNVFHSFEWVELDFFSLECNEVSSKEF